jgi:hypothetical protein
MDDGKSTRETERDRERQRATERERESRYAATLNIFDLHLTKNTLFSKTAVRASQIQSDRLKLRLQHMRRRSDYF